jgi:gluconokinase
MIQPSGFIVMGVSGCGKSTIASLLAQRLGWNFFDADDFHPAENVAKMKAGIPLNDNDRAPWLERLHDLLASEQNVGRHPILACSALKDRYRAVLRQNLPNLIVIYLRGTEELIRSRMESREGHFMPPALLKSQFEALEEPEASPSVWVADLTNSPEEIVESLLRRMES